MHALSAPGELPALMPTGLIIPCELKKLLCLHQISTLSDCPAVSCPI